MQLFILLLLFPALALASPPVTVLTVDDAITPATADYVSRGLKRAADTGSGLVVLKLDTPGGLDPAMREIVRAILASPVPVAAFVAPSGARAASAGTFILYASHIAAMAPGTNVGAASPVAIGMGGVQDDRGPPPRPDDDAKSSKDKAAPEQSQSTMARKQTHDAAAYIRSLAQLRGRNADWAEKAVREAVSLPAADALATHVVDYMASDVPGLLREVQGRHVSVADGEVTLDVAGAQLIVFDPDWRARLLSVVASPSVALILMMLGVYGLLFEFASPGYVLPGVVGGICLLLALFSLQLLPFSYSGLGLIALGIAFLVAEVFVPTSGVLGVGGVIALAIGAVILIDTDVPGYGVPLPLVLGITGVSALFVLVLVNLAVQARRRRIVTGPEELLGSPGEVMADFTGRGWARVHGETWQVRSTAPLREGERVRVVGVDGLTLEVESESMATKGGVA